MSSIARISRATAVAALVAPLLASCSSKPVAEEDVHQAELRARIARAEAEEDEARARSRAATIRTVDQSVRVAAEAAKAGTETYADVEDARRNAGKPAAQAPPPPPSQRETSAPAPSPITPSEPTAAPAPPPTTTETPPITAAD